MDDSSFSSNAVDKFNNNKSGTAELNERFHVNIIATEADHSRLMQLNDMSSFVLLREAFNRTPRRDYARLGSNHTRIIAVKYELAEKSPRTPDIKDIKFLPGALDFLKSKGADEFTKMFGDYFVAGYTWGLRYDATVEIVVEPGKSYREQEEVKRYPWGWEERRRVREYDPGKLCDQISELVQAVIKAVYERNNINNNLNILESEFHDITLRVSHSSRTGTAGDISFTLRDFIKSLEDYIKSSRNFDRAKYEQLYVTLIRYRELAEARPYIPEAINTNVTLYLSIRNFIKKIVKTRCYYNALMAINPNNLMTGKTLQDSWEKEFETDLVTKVDTGLNYICADLGRINDYHNKFANLYFKYRALAERYNFYCYFTRVKQGSSSPSWSDSTAHDYATVYTRGFSDYTRSEYVQADMRAGSTVSMRHEEPWYKGPRGADFSGASSNGRIYYFETGYKDTNHSQGWDVNGKTLGKNNYHWRYKGAGGSTALNGL